MAQPCKKIIKVLFIGQTPPPYGGQAIMQQVILDGTYRRIQFHHVRMAFSKEMDEVGKFHFKKLLHLALIICKIIFFRFKFQTKVIYYPPAGPNKIPMYRDIIILCCTRWLFQKTIFHFHAGGISELYDRLSPILKFFYRLAYFKPDLTIQLSELNPPDGSFFQSKRNITLPYGIKDHYPEFRNHKCIAPKIPTLLFVGVIRESKGVLILLDACRQVMESGLSFQLNLMGHFESTEFQKTVDTFIEKNDLKDRIRFIGVCTGKKKWTAFQQADIFCFPTFFESETFGVVILEAMQFKLPVISTCWRGIPSVVAEGKTGFLIPIKESRPLAAALIQLLKRPQLMKKMGNAGRNLFLQRFTLNRYYHDLEAALILLFRTP